MADWWKLIAGGIIGFATALFAKPVQEYIEQNVRLRQIRKSLYLELGRNLNLYAEICRQMGMTLRIA